MTSQRNLACRRSAPDCRCKPSLHNRFRHYNPGISRHARLCHRRNLAWPCEGTSPLPDGPAGSAPWPSLLNTCVRLSIQPCASLRLSLLFHHPHHPSVNPPQPTSNRSSLGLDGSCPPRIPADGERHELDARWRRSSPCRSNPPPFCRVPPKRSEPSVSTLRTLGLGDPIFTLRRAGWVGERKVGQRRRKIA